MEYTPGEWKITQVASNQLIIEASSKDIAEVLSYDTGEHLANAHLISASPDLYEACKEAFNLLIDLRGLIVKHPVYLDKAKSVDSKLWQAIAKAEAKEC